MRIKDSPLSLQKTWTQVDTAVLSVLLLFSIALTATTIRWHEMPAEDAMMLLRYEQHLVHGQGITWNVGERPLEGATDFLFLVALGGWIKLSHLGPIVAARTFLGTMQVISVGWLYAACRKLFGTAPALAGILALYLATGPGILHASNGFSPPFYGLAALIAWTFACACVKDGPTLRRSIAFALSALIAGLIRPDGVMLALFMVIALVYALREASRQIVTITIGVFAILGGTYFAWRFHYFGYLLPNPFYKKGGGHLHLESIRVSVSTIFKMLLPVMPVYAAGLVARRARRVTIFAAIPLVLFAVVWVLLTPENNVDSRFQYVVVPMGLLSAAMIWNELRAEIRLRSWVPAGQSSLRRASLPWIAMAAALVTIPMDMAWWRALFPPDPVGTGNYKIALGMLPLARKHYTLAVTEAGMVPYFSQWRTIDAWGLNDATIVHDKRGLTEDYLAAQNPAIILFNLSPKVAEGGQVEFEQVWRGEAPEQQTISHLLGVMSHFAQTHNYELAARWGVTPCLVHVWYVRRDLPEAGEMMKLIRQQPHFFTYGNELATNYMQQDPPRECEHPAAAVSLNQ